MPDLNSLLQMLAQFSPDVKQAAGNVGTALTQPRLSDADSPMMARMQGFGAGGAEGLLKLLAALSQPASSGANYLLRKKGSM